MSQQNTTEHKFSPVDRTAALLRMLSLIRDMGRTGTAEIQLIQCSPKGFWWAEKSRHLKETAVAVIESLEAA